MPKINFCASKEDTILIHRIIQRLLKVITPEAAQDISVVEAEMDLTACHMNGCALKLQELLESTEFDLIHDVIGIMRHIDRTTGQLQNCFCPRFAM